MKQLAQASQSFWKWVNSNWFTKLVFALAFLIVIVRLSTTCIEALGVRIGCGDPDYDYEVMDEYGPYPEDHYKEPPKE